MAKVAVLKTKENTVSVEDFINTVADNQQREDSLIIVKLMEKVSKEQPKMWGASMIGFGNIRYKSARSGREVDWFNIGFSPRKSALSLHLVLDFKTHADTLQKLGKYKTGAGCLYINKLDDVDINVLELLIDKAIQAKY